MALIYPQNGDLKKLLKSSRKKVPQSARLSAGGGGAKAKRAMPKCPLHEFEGGFPNTGMTLPGSIHNFTQCQRRPLLPTNIFSENQKNGCKLQDLHVLLK